MARQGALAKILLSLALFLVLSEVGLRWGLGQAKVSRDAGPAAYFAALGAFETDRPMPSRRLPPKDGFRVVVLGDSTAVGFPYSLFLGSEGQRLGPTDGPRPSPTDLSFSRFLADGLRAATGTPIDLQGFTIQGRASVGVLADLDAAFAARPDLLIVYVGHNELTWRLTRMSPYGRARHGALDLVFAGWHDLVRGLGVGARTRAAERLDGMPPTFALDLESAARLLALGDPETRLPENLPLEPREVALHLDRYEANLRTLVARAREARVRLVLVEPASSLLAAPVASGRLWDDRAQRAWEAGSAARARDPRAARAKLVEARDLDPAPVRLTSQGLERLRRAAGDTARAVLDDGAIEERFVDLIHPTPELAAVFAERIAAALPFDDAPRLAPGDGAALERFRAALRERLANRADVIELGNAVGVALAAYVHLQYGNRAAAEADVRAVPEDKRDFRLTLLMDLALRWRGARAEANDLLARAAARHPDWAPSIDWWRRRADR